MNLLKRDKREPSFGRLLLHKFVSNHLKLMKKLHQIFPPRHVNDLHFDDSTFMRVFGGVRIGGSTIGTPWCHPDQIIVNRFPSLDDGTADTGKGNSSHALHTITHRTKGGCTCKFSTGNRITKNQFYVVKSCCIRLSAFLKFEVS